MMKNLDAFFQAYLIPLNRNASKENASSIEDSAFSQLTLLLTQPNLNHYEITQVLSDILTIPWLDLNEFDPNFISLKAISEPLIRTYPLLPLFQRNNRLYIGLANPFHPSLVEAIRFHTQHLISMILVEKPKLDAWRQTLLRNPTLPLQRLANTAFQKPDTAASPLAATHNMNDPPLIRYVNQLLENALHKCASDIHFEPRENQLLYIRFRIDGVLYPQDSPPIPCNRILSRIKIMAQLDIAENRLPQDGRFSFKLPDNENIVDCRVSTCPTLQGEKIAVRLLNDQQISLDLKELGLHANQYTELITALQQPQGMILVTGPTGSGKTLTLYSGLQYLNQTTVNIVSVEDPIEIYLPGINQVNIRPKIGLHFAEILKVLLRQDPDIMMIGEIRNQETAHIAIQAAQTGHLVLSTLHTNSAAETLTRLINIGIPTYHIVSSIKIIIAQRLVRQLCIHCKEPYEIKPEILIAQGIKINKPLSIFRAKGCKHCQKGYKGRIGVFELLKMSPTLIASISQEKPAMTMKAQAQKEGMLTLKMAGFEKLKAGMIDLIELYKIT